MTTASELVRRYSVASAAFAAVLSPLPFADEVALVPVYAELARRIGKHHGLGAFAIPWRPIGATVAKGLVARGVVNIGLSFIPGVDAFVNAVTAVALTEIVGRHIEASCADPSAARPLAFRSLLEQLSAERTRAPYEPRRLRTEVPGLYGDAVRAARIERDLLTLPGVCEARANFRSGRVLVVAARPIACLRSDIDCVLRDASDPQARAAPTLRGLATAVGRTLRSVARAPEKWWHRRREGVDTSAFEPSAPPWHAMPIEVVARTLEVNLVRGLASRSVAERRRACGANLLPRMRPRTAIDIVAGEVLTLPTALLAGAIGLSIVSGDILEGAAIAVVLLSNIGIGYYSEARAEELLGAWEKLRAERAKVLRDGREVTIAASDVVPGDVLLLSAGETVSADARIVEADDFTVDESMLTGESEPVEKGLDTAAEDAPLADRTSVVHSGTVVSSGRARAIVVATGNATALGAIQRALSRTDSGSAPLERQLAELGRTLAWLSLGSSVLVTALGLMHGRPVRVLVQNAIALGVAGIPEGVPTVGTTALALVSQRLQKRGIVIRRLAAAETLGAVGVVCADKTGTLTENRMRVAEILLPDSGWGGVRADRRGMSITTRTDAPIEPARLHDLARIAALNADVEINNRGEVTSGSGTERALVEFALATGYPARHRRRTAKRTGERRRSAESPMMLTVHDHPELGRIELAKGAPEEVIPRCGDLDPEKQREVMAENTSMASRGLRVLAFAWRRDATAPLEFTGLIGLRDPARPHVREAIRSLDRAGVRTMMLTGDQHRTALAIGRELGIDESAIYSRVTPEAKLEIVQELEAQGSVVAMTGDGVNDGPALKAAHVGIAMGARGTDLARAVADVVLAHDDLPSIVEAVAEGRTLYDNVKRAIDYLVATNMSEVALMLIGAVLGISPLRPMHLLWINVLTDIAPALALAVEPRAADIMQRLPRDSSASFFGTSDWRRLGRRALQMAGGALVAHAVGSANSENTKAERAPTMAFVSLVVSQLLEARNHRASTSGDNPELRWVLAGSFLAQLFAVTSSGVRAVLGDPSLGPIELATAVTLGAVATRAGGRPFISLEPRDAVLVTRDAAVATAEEQA